MRSRSDFIRASAFAALLIAPGQALSQPDASMSGDVSQPGEEITVTAPKAVTMRTLQPAIGKKPAIQILTARRTVDFSDLNLSKTEDVKKLEARIHGAAVAACRDIEPKYPASAYIPTPPNQDCVAMATKAPISMVRLIHSSFHE